MATKLNNMKQGEKWLKEYAYIDEAIESKIKGQLFFREADVNFYFKNRHTGLAGISNEMVVDQCFAAIRRLRVWREIKYRNDNYGK